MLTRKGYDRIKKFIHWQDKPDGAVDALVEICAEEASASLAERAARLSKAILKSYEHPIDHAHIQSEMVVGNSPQA
jgi:hypothetical protein